MLCLNYTWVCSQDGVCCFSPQVCSVVCLPPQQLQVPVGLVFMVMHILVVVCRIRMYMYMYICLQLHKIFTFCAGLMYSVVLLMVLVFSVSPKSLRSVLGASVQCYVRMTCNTPTPGHLSAADDAWYWQKRVLRIG